MKALRWQVPRESGYNSQMPWLPYQRFVITTSIPIEELGKRLSDEVEPTKYFRWFDSNSKPYQGEVNRESFKIHRILGYRNSFNPIIEGTLSRAMNKTEVSITMRLHRAALAFALVWVSAVSSIGFSIVGSNKIPAENQLPVPAALFPIAMLVFFYLITMGGFIFEASKSKKFLEELFR